MVLEIISEQEYAVWVYVCENGKCDRELMLKPYGKIELEVMDSIELVEIKFHNKLRVIDNVILAIWDIVQMIIEYDEKTVELVHYDFITTIIEKWERDDKIAIIYKNVFLPEANRDINMGIVEGEGCSKCYVLDEKKFTTMNGNDIFQSMFSSMIFCIPFVGLLFHFISVSNYIISGLIIVCMIGIISLFFKRKMRVRDFDLIEQIKRDL